MAIVLAFLLGMGNFAWHRAVLESGHAMMRDVSPGGLQAIRLSSLSLEFVLLCGALYAADAGLVHGVWLYFGYSLINGIAAWAIVKRRV